MRIAVWALLLAAPFGCAPAPKNVPPPVRPVVTAPPAPAKHATMICRNSQDGRSVACGTPNAVMVGIKED